MKALIAIATFAILGIWTLFVWIAHAFVAFAGSAASTNADILPIPPEWVVLTSDSLGWLAGISGMLAVIVWALGALVIAVLGGVGYALASRGKGLKLPGKQFTGRFTGGGFGRPSDGRSYNDRRSYDDDRYDERPRRSFDDGYDNDDDRPYDNRPARSYGSSSRDRGLAIGEMIGRALKKRLS